MTDSARTYPLIYVDDAAHALKSLGWDVGWTIDETTDPTTARLVHKNETLGTWPVHWRQTPATMRAQSAKTAGLLISLAMRADARAQIERLTRSELVDALDAATAALADAFSELAGWRP